MKAMMKTVSGLAILAAAGLFATTASAADLGGNCCTDLEERIAELEATTVRKGQRNLSVILYGQVSMGMIWWDDGAENNFYLIENQSIKNKLGVRGSAKLSADISVGYNLEIQIRSFRSHSVDQLIHGYREKVSAGAYGPNSISLRRAHWFIRSQHWGRFLVGLNPSAATGTSTVTLVNPGGFSGFNGPGFAHMDFKLRRSGLTGNAGLSQFTWETFAYNWGGAAPTRGSYAGSTNVVRYDSPFFLGLTKKSGFTFATSYQADDGWDVALRYAEEFRSQFRVAAAIGYVTTTAMDPDFCANPSRAALNNRNVINPSQSAGSDVDCSALGISGSVLHIPSGVFISGGWLHVEDKNRKRAFRTVQNYFGRNPNGVINDQDDAWWVMAGIRVGHLVPHIGATTFWGGYVEHENGLQAGGVNLTGQTATGPGSDGVFDVLRGTDVLNSLGTNAYILDSNVKSWSLGISQQVKAAGMNIWLSYHNYSVDATIADLNDISNRAKANPIDDMNLVAFGATVKF